MGVYPLGCPSCGRQLRPVVAAPDTAPWLCAQCFRGWWPSELGVEARAGWLPLSRSFHWRLWRDMVGPGVEADRLAAVSVGCSLVAEHVPLLSVLELEAAVRVLRSSSAAGLRGLVEAALAARGAAAGRVA